MKWSGSGSGGRRNVAEALSLSSRNGVRAEFGLGKRLHQLRTFPILLRPSRNRIPLVHLLWSKGYYSCRRLFSIDE